MIWKSGRGLCSLANVDYLVLVDGYEVKRGLASDQWRRYLDVRQRDERFLLMQASNQLGPCGAMQPSHQHVWYHTESGINRLLGDDHLADLAVAFRLAPSFLSHKDYVCFPYVHGGHGLLPAFREVHLHISHRHVV